MIESRELTRKFGQTLAVDRVSMTLEPGHVYAMLGPNGSGKTTWMKMAAGLVKPTSGTVSFAGEPVGIESRKHVAYMSTEPFFYGWMTIGDVGRYYADFFADFSKERFENLISRMDLNAAMKTRSLSTGMAAKLKIAATMARDAMVYMLDEPFNGIDLLTRDQIRQCILESVGADKLLILSSHLVEEMEAVADRAVFIKKGRLIEMTDREKLHADGVTMADRYRAIYGHEEVGA